MRWWWWCCQALIRLGGSAVWNMRVFGTHHIPREGGALLASNHQSYLDPPLVASCLPREMHFMARKSLFRNPVFRALISTCNAFPIERDSADVSGLKEAFRRLRAGNLLLVFPEGTRTRNGSIGPMKAGIGMMAARARVPIVPVLIDGAYEVWPRGRALPRLLTRRLTIRFGRPIPPERKTDAMAADRLYRAVAELKGDLVGCRTGRS